MPLHLVVVPARYSHAKSIAHTSMGGGDNKLTSGFHRKLRVYVELRLLVMPLEQTMVSTVLIRAIHLTPVLLGE